MFFREIPGMMFSKTFTPHDTGSLDIKILFGRLKGATCQQGIHLLIYTMRHVQLTTLICTFTLLNDYAGDHLL